MPEEIKADQDKEDDCKRLMVFDDEHSDIFNCEIPQSESFASYVYFNSNNVYDVRKLIVKDSKHVAAAMNRAKGYALVC